MPTISVVVIWTFDTVLGREIPRIFCHPGPDPGFSDKVVAKRLKTQQTLGKEERWGGYRVTGFRLLPE